MLGFYVVLNLPASDPVPELKHVLLINSKVLNLWTIGGQSNKVLGHSTSLECQINVPFRPKVHQNLIGSHIFCCLQEPFLGSVGVSNSLLSGESL